VAFCLTPGDYVCNTRHSPSYNWLHWYPVYFFATPFSIYLTHFLFMNILTRWER
jgi:hypothetical protein